MLYAFFPCVVSKTKMNESPVNNYGEENVEKPRIFSLF